MNREGLVFSVSGAALLLIGCQPVSGEMTPTVSPTPESLQPLGTEAQQSSVTPYVLLN